MSTYRAHFPGKLLPKHHIFEHHVFPWIETWGMGLGLHGEQGCESVHKTFNKLMTVHAGVRNDLKRLMCVMKEHITSCSPALN